jgi:hypothetical protein
MSFEAKNAELLAAYRKEMEDVVAKAKTALGL